MRNQVLAVAGARVRSAIVEHIFVNLLPDLGSAVVVLGLIASFVLNLTSVVGPTAH